MSDKDDTEARRRRAQELREQIAGIMAGGQGETRQERLPEARRNAPRVRSISPRAFVERRMQELDRSNQREKN
ncbi:MAG TPA: hypothetical protein VE690_11480 [Rhodopila sp.]|nr:hypothetical protein [Rhodopila sp.]